MASKPKPKRAAERDLFGDIAPALIPKKSAPVEKVEISESVYERFAKVPLADVAVDGPVRGTFTYLAGEFLAQLTPGTRVLVPFGNRALPGFFIRAKSIDDLKRDAVNPERLKSIIKVLDEDGASISPTLLELARWMARHYVCALGGVLAAMLPAGVKRGMDSARVRFVETDLSNDDLLALAETLSAKKTSQSAVLYALSLLKSEHSRQRPISAAEILQESASPSSALKSLETAGVLRIVAKSRVEIEAENTAPVRTTNLVLNDEQEAALSPIEAALQSNAFAGFLLQGVTGSGKTEIYLRALQTVLSLGKQAIVLVPEIALTPQTAERFENRLGRERVAVLHSHITDGERSEAWRAIRAGKIEVVVGARSALFAPFKNLGAIVIDEEHENAFKQESSPRYHARDAAFELARISKSVLILGSATPSFESLYAAKTGALKHLFLSKRATSQPLPPVSIIDLSHENRETKKYTYLSRALLRAMQETLERGQQTILFMNRRGFATVINCLHCGSTEKCAHCDIALTSHRDSDTLVCHYCNFTKPIPENCSVCGSPGMKHWGLGTERVETEVRKIFPSARIARMDSDTMTKRSSYIETLGAFRARKTDILIGTQMVAKGLDFPSVTLVGVVLADTSLHMPDFRGRERTFQLISQVAGRAGRGEVGGRVIVQTHLPNDSAIKAAAQHDYDSFSLEELKERRSFFYPPFSKLARIIMKGKDAEALDRGAHEVARFLKSIIVENGALKKIDILGPTEAPIAKIEDRFRRHILIKAPDSETLSLLLDGPAADMILKLKDVESAVDIDAVAML